VARIVCSIAVLSFSATPLSRSAPIERTIIRCIQPSYLRPTATIAEQALLPADPGLAMRLAQELTSAPLMANHHHGLWGYSGETAAREPVTVQSTGIGGPSAAAVLRELGELGVRRAIRVGVATALDPAMAGAVVVVGSALCEDGASRAYGAGGEIEADAALTGALVAVVHARPALIASRDVALDPRCKHADALREAGVVAVDLETAALLAAGAASRVAVAAALIACTAVAPDHDRVERELVALGGLCVGALARPQAPADLG
jgi:uridine phosphorylase